MTYLISILSIVLLVIAIPIGLPYGYYVLLRWVICACAAFMTYFSFKQQKNVFVFAFIVIALVFNPILPLSLGKGLWVIVDAIAAFIFFGSLFVVKAEKS